MQDLDRLERVVKFSLIVSSGITAAITPTLTQMLADSTNLAPDFVQQQLRAALLYGLITVCTIGAEILAQLTLETSAKDSRAQKFAKFLVHAILYSVAFLIAAGIYAAIRWQVVGLHFANFAAGLPIFAAYSLVVFVVLQLNPFFSRSFGIRAHYKQSKPS